jgi:hypothetical protein
MPRPHCRPAAVSAAPDPGAILRPNSKRLTRISTDPGVPALTVTDPLVAPGAIAVRAAPAGMPAVDARPPVVAESDDPFTALRVIDLVARLERGRPVRLDDLVDHLNATHLDWLFSRSVVVDQLLQLQANWMADYRNASGIELDEEGTYGTTLTVEDSTRVDPWIVRQAQRAAAEAQERLRAFSRLDRATGE